MSTDNLDDDFNLEPELKYRLQNFHINKRKDIPQLLESSLPQLINEIDKKILNICPYNINCLIVDITLKDFQIYGPPGVPQYWYKNSGDKFGYRQVHANDIRRFIENKLLEEIKNKQNNYSSCGPNEIILNKYKKYEEIIKWISLGLIFRDLIDGYRSNIFSGY